MSLVPKHRASDAADAAFLSSRYGLTPDPWQLAVLDSWLGLRRDLESKGMKWSAMRCGLAVPRQNGKNAIIEMRELFGMITLGERFLHTAHEVKTARKAFARLRSFFDDQRRYPELAELVQDIRQTNGQEAIILTNGGSCEFVARSKGSARGFTVDVLVMDEAQDLNDDQIEALLPTISAAPSGNPQQIFTGTPPGPSVSGEIFTRLRSDGLARKDKRLSWHEWSCPADVDLDDPESLAMANPALGIRLHRDVAEAERGTLTEAGYGRERLGMWDEASLNRIIDAKSWALVADTTSLPAERLALGIEVAPDRSMSSVALAGERADGLWHVELDEHRVGTGWIVPWVKARCERNEIRAVVIDTLSPAASLLDEFKAAKIKVTTTTGTELANACGQFYDGVMNTSIRHTDQPQVNVALSAVGKRPLGDRWVWNRRTANADITPIVAETLALWGSQTNSVKRPGGRRTSERRATVM